MAFVSKGWVLTVTLIDRGLNQTTKTYQLTSADAAAAATDAAAVMAALAGVSAAAQAKYSLGEVFEDDAVVLPPSSADAQIEVVASITTFIDNEGSKKANYGIPAPIVANVFLSTSGANSNIVNTSSAQIIAYHGIFGVGGEATLSDGEVAGVIISGVRTTKRSRQG